MKTFNDFGLSDKILKAITELGFVTPTPIQEKTIPNILNDKQDLIGLAQTGTGKTAGFGLPIIQQISPDKKAVQAMILCPTRELCLQITKDFESFCKYSAHISIVAVYGGASIEQQIRSIKKGAQIIVGTPGRTLDLLNRRALKVNHIQWLVLDEADEMLNMGFRDDMDAILENTPAEKQTLLFSATMPDGVRHISKDYMKNPIEISAGKKNTGADNVQHHYYLVKPHDRYLALKRLADIHPDIYGIIFCRTRSETKDLADKLIVDGYSADALHGDLSQAQRDHVMKRFRTKQLQLLIATDVAARGLDINNLTHVINYNLPDDSELYLHRSGRTGRAGKTGISIIITQAREERRIRELEKLIGKKFIQKNIPSGQEICEKRLYNLMDKIENIQVDEQRIAPYWETINKKLQWIDRDELLKRFISVEFNEFLTYYKDAKDMNVSKGENTPVKKHSSDKKFSRFFINLGSKNKIRVPTIIGLINENTRQRNIEIGKIDIFGNFSFFEVDKEYEQVILNAFKNASYEGNKLTVQISKPETTQKKNEFRGGRERKERKRY